MPTLAQQRPAVELELKGVEFDRTETGGIGMEPKLASMP
jgi:hypothetical protein